jgi:hypothetical protein
MNQVQGEKQEIGMMMTAGHVCAAHTGNLTTNDLVLII